MLRCRISINQMFDIAYLQYRIYWQEVSHVYLYVCTFMTEGSSVCRLVTVAGKTIGFFNTATLVLAEWTVAAAVARAARSDPRGDLSPLFQVQSDTIQLQRSNAA